MIITKPDYSTISKAFESYYQTTISKLKAGHPQFANLKDNVIINIQYDALWGRIPKTILNGGTFENLSKERQEIFYKALIQQIYYVLTEGDFTAMSGYDVSNNTFLSAADMERVAISKAARQTLLDGGLLYTGLNGRGGGTVFPYPGRRFP